jgi:hypothetical protein
MPTSLLDYVNDELIAPDLLSACARRLGTSEDVTRAALQASFASILAGLAAITGNLPAMEVAFDIVNDPDNDHPPQDALGSRLLSELFGPQRLPVGELIGRSAKLTGGLGAVVLSLAAPLVLGALRWKITSAGLNPASLSRMLAAEREQILRAAPVGVESLVDAGSREPEVPGTHRQPASRQTSRARLWHAVSALGLAGIVAFVTREPQADPEETGMAVAGISLACGGRQVELTETDQGAIITAGTQMIELRRTRTASGVRYDAFGEPPRTFVSDRGAVATVVVEGDTYPECRRVR